MLKLPKFSLLEKNNLGGECSCCGRSIKYVYTIRENKSKEVLDYGSGCAKKAMGISVSKMVEENIAYEKAVKQAKIDEDMAERGRTYIEAFEEANPEMLAYIEENYEGNNFLTDIKTRIELSGTLSKPQFDAVFRAMLPVAQLPEKFKDLSVYILTMSAKEGQWGWSYTVIAMTEKNEKIRIFFSSLSDKNEAFLRKLGVLSINDFGKYMFASTTDKRFPIKLSGSFDGYKVKRAKISL